MLCFTNYIGFFKDMVIPRSYLSINEFDYHMYYSIEQK